MMTRKTANEIAEIILDSVDVDISNVLKVEFKMTATTDAVIDVEYVTIPDGKNYGTRFDQFWLK